MMRSISVLKFTNIFKVNHGWNNFKKGKSSIERISFNPSIFRLLAEGGVNFLRYLKNLDLAGEPNLIILSSRNHYHYDKNDLKSVRTLINLRKLNLIKHLDMFLNSLVRILPPNTNFIGCFSHRKTWKENEFNVKRLSGMLNRLFGFPCFRTDHNMNKNEVIELLERNNFRIVDMKEKNGLTYFYSQNISRPV
jgi:hypothetical protein